MRHYPACPSCGNLCGRLAQVCADCGALLFVDTSLHARLQSRGVKDRRKAAEQREDAEARKGKAV